MSHMSPLMLVILKALRIIVLGISALMAVFLGLALWQRTQAAGLESLTRQDYTFMAVLLAILLAGLWLARSIKREISRTG